MNIVFSRHVRRRMRLRHLNEADVKAVIESPESIEASIRGRLNYWGKIRGRSIRITLASHNDEIVVITVVERKKK